MSSFLAHLLQNTLIVAAAVPLVLLFARWRRHRPAEQHALWLLLTIKLILPPLWTVEWPDITTTPPTVVTEVAEVEQAVDPPPSEIVATLDPPVAIAVTIAAPVVQDYTPQDRRPAPAYWTRSQVLELATRLLCLVYVAGTLVFAATTLRRIHRDLQLVRKSKPAPQELVDYVATTAKEIRPGRFQVRVADGLAGPVVLWWNGSLLLWPLEMTHADQRQRSIGALLHELAHLRRYDHVVAWLEMFVAVVHWWNPVFWCVRTRLRESREVACDAMALQRGDVSRQAYAELLVDLTTGQSFRTAPLPSVGVGAVSKSSLKRRIAMIFEPKISGRMTSGGALLALGLVALLLVTVEQTSGQSKTPERVGESSLPSGTPQVSEGAPLKPEPSLTAPQTPTATVIEVSPSLGGTPHRPVFESLQLRTAMEIETPLPAEVAEAIRQAVTKVIDEKIKNGDSQLSEAERNLYKQWLERWLATLPSGQIGSPILRPRVVYESNTGLLSQRTELLQPQPAVIPPVVPAPVTVVTEDWKYDLELAEITYEEKAVELDSARHMLEVVSKAAQNNSVSTSELSEAQRKVKLAELGIRKARIEIERIKRRAGNQ